MRFNVLPLFFATACFVVGLFGVKWIGESGREPLDEGARKTRALSDLPATVRAETAAAQPAGVAAKAWSEALAKFGDDWSVANDRTLTAALLRLDAADFPAGVDEMLKCFGRLQSPFSKRGNELAEAWMDRWLEIDSQGALQFLSHSQFFAQLSAIRGFGKEYRDSSCRTAIFNVLAEREPGWTRQTIAGLEPGALREIGVCALLNQAARRDAALATRLLAGFADRADRSPALAGYVAGLVVSNVQAAFDVARAESPGDLRDHLLQTIFCELGKRGMNTASELLDRIDNPAERQKQANAALSASYVEGREDLLPFVKEESERMAARDGWPANSWQWGNAVDVASRGPQARAFADWAANFAPDKDRTLLGYIVRTWAPRNPVEFGKWLSENATKLDPAAIAKLSEATAYPAADRSWSEALPPGVLRDQALFQTALSAGKEGDITQAAAAYSAVAASDSKGAFAEQLASVLARQDGATAADWATQQPPGPAREAALDTVAKIWSARDVQGAAQWIEELPPGAERDRAVQAYATTVVMSDAEVAAQWVEQVADPALRTQTANTVFSHWRIQNPVAARAWLRDLPGIERGMLEKFMRNAR